MTFPYGFGTVKLMKTSKFFHILLCLIPFAANFADAMAKDFWDQNITTYKLDPKNQAFCINKNEELLFLKNADLKVKPASVTKLYVTDWALNKLSKDYRYQTKFLLNGTELHIQGGNDPYFVSESLLAVLNFLNGQGITKLTKVTFDENFFLNWTDDKVTIATQIKKYTNTKKWNKSIRREFNLIKNNLKSINLENLEMQVLKVEYSNDSNLFTDHVITFSSSPLYKHMKQMNIYSNNFYAQKLFEVLGNSQEFEQYLLQEYGFDKTQIYFYTGSGLGENYTTCNVTMKMIDHLKEMVEKNNLELSDVVSVAGIDKGTLTNRFKDSITKQSVIAKTGTLNSIVTLSGFLNTDSGFQYFGIFNKTSDLANGRKFQDKVIFDYLKSQVKVELNYEEIIYSPIEDIIIDSDY